MRIWLLSWFWGLGLGGFPEGPLIKAFGVPLKGGLGFRAKGLGCRL